MARTNMGTRNGEGMRAQNQARRIGLFGRKKRAVQYYDYNLVASILLLTCFGLVMLYSTSAYSAQVDYGDDMYYFKKQAAISAICFLGMLVGSLVDYHIYAKFAVPLYIGSNFLVVITRFVGVNVNGATRWLKIGPIQFQPAEMAKLAIVVFLAVTITKMGKNVQTMKAFYTLLALGGAPALFTLVFTENLSTAIIIGGITFGLLILVFRKRRPLEFVGSLVALFCILVIAYVKMGGRGGYRIQRVVTWLDPKANASTGGYQIMQGLYAIGSGGLFGKGLGNSLQKLDYVPEAQNDMILTIIGEELGMFGILMLTLLFVFLIYHLFLIAENAPDLLGSLIAAGVFLHISLQVILNIAVVTNSIPTTGITLPFVSYGGTAVLFLMAEMGLVLSVSRRIHWEE